MELKERNRFNLLERISKVFAFYLICIFPLLIGNRGYENITVFKFRTFWISTVVYVSACLLVLLYYFSNSNHPMRIRKSENRLRLSMPQIILLIYVLWCAISSVSSVYGKSTWIGQGRYEGMFSVLLYSTVFILLSFWGEYSNWYCRGMAVMAFVLSFIAFRQFSHEGIIYPEGYSYYGYWFLSTIGHHDCFGGLASVIVPVMFASFVLGNDRFWDVAELISGAFLLFVFLITDVDSGKVGLLVGFAVMIPFLFDNRKKTSRALAGFGILLLVFFLFILFPYRKGEFEFEFSKKALVCLLASVLLLVLGTVLSCVKKDFGISQKIIRGIVLFLLIGVVLAGCIFVFTYDGENRLIKEASELMHGRLDDSAGTERGYIWKTSLKLAKEQPVLGSGPGTFYARYKQYEIFYTETDFAHNDFLQNAVCVGFVGMAIYVAFCLSLAVRSFSKGYEHPAVVIFGCGCAGYLAHSFFSFSIAIITPLFWVLAGVLDKVVRQVEWSESIASRSSVKKEHKQ